MPIGISKGTTEKTHRESLKKFVQKTHEVFMEESQVKGVGNPVRNTWSNSRKYS